MQEHPAPYDMPAPTRTEESKTLPPNDTSDQPTVSTDIQLEHSTPNSPSHFPSSPDQQISPTTLPESSADTSTAAVPPLSSPKSISPQLRRSERVRRFPRHLEDFAGNLQ